MSEGEAEGVEASCFFKEEHFPFNRREETRTTNLRYRFDSVTQLEVLNRKYLLHILNRAVAEYIRSEPGSPEREALYNLVNSRAEHLRVYTTSPSVKLPRSFKADILVYTCIDDVPEDHAYIFFRFTRDELDLLCDQLGFRQHNFYATANENTKYDGERAMLLMLYKLASPGITNFELGIKFGFKNKNHLGGRSCSWASDIFKRAVFYVFDNFEHLLQGKLGKESL